MKLKEKMSEEYIYHNWTEIDVLLEEKEEQQVILKGYLAGFEAAKQLLIDQYGRNKWIDISVRELRSIGEEELDE